VLPRLHQGQSSHNSIRPGLACLQNLKGLSQGQSQSYIMTDGKSASLSWCQAPSGAQDQILLLSVTGLLMWGTLSNERMSVSFTIAAGSCQRSHSGVRVPRGSYPYFTISGSRLPQPEGSGPSIYISQGMGWTSHTPKHWVPYLSPPTTRRAMVEVFEPASIWGADSLYILVPVI
jgi:hypothetical protein